MITNLWTFTIATGSRRIHHGSSPQEDIRAASCSLVTDFASQVQVVPTLLTLIELLHGVALVCEHLIEVLGPRLLILLVLVNQDGSENQLIESLHVVCTSCLLFLFRIFAPILAFISLF